MKLLRHWWGRFLFQDRGVLPTVRLVVMLGVMMIVVSVLSFLKVSWWFVLTSYIVVICISLIDLAFSPTKKQIKLSRDLLEDLERNANKSISLTVHNKSKYDCIARFADDTPLSFEAILPIKQKLQANTATKLTYPICPRIRGDYALSRVFIRYRSLIGLWEKQQTVQLDAKVKVIPNLAETRQYLASAQHYLLHEGVKIRKQRSGNGEFAKVRNYVVGDDPRKINWHQSAKLQEVMTNEYEPEHGKHITLLIDCGRMMGIELTTGNRLERSVEAAITVAAAALKNGDYVAVIAFSKKIKAYVPPGKGLAHLDVILQSIYHVQVDQAESNYQEALQYAQSVQRKRSLMLLFSDIYQFVLEDQALFFIKRVQRKHLFVLIGIEDELLLDKVKLEPDTAITAMHKTVAQKQVQWKKQQMFKWKNQGLVMLEAPEDRLAVTAVSHYMEQLNRGVL